MPAVTMCKRALVVLCLSGCAATPGVSKRTRKPTAPPSEAPSLRVVFKAGFAFAEEQGRQWRIAEVGRDEMLWAPDGMRFAYVTAVTPQKKADGDKDRYQIVIRNLRGDSVNAFPVYRPGKPMQLEWIDDQHLSYEAPPDPSGNAYVVHSADSGEVLVVRRGEQFVWSPGKKRLAYVVGRRRRRAIKVDEEQVWPRNGRRLRGAREIISDLVWSPDGNGLAFLVKKGKKSRLVVLLAVDDVNGDLSWELPRGAGKGVNKLFWAESKVFVGESSVKPHFAASWTRVR